MRTPSALLLFLLFAVILFVMYIAVRRRWGPPVLAGALGFVACIVVMTLNSLAQGNDIYRAIFSGLLVGGLFSIGVLAMAWYFMTNEQRKQRLPPLE